MTVNADLNTFLESNPEWEGHVDLLVSPPDAQEVLERYPEISAETDLIKAGDHLIGNWQTRMAFYVLMRENGMAHRLAAMLAEQRAPKAMTDREFFEGIGTLDKQLGGSEKMTVLPAVIKAAKKRGYTPNPNDVYQSALARFQGDPEAFVPATGGRNHVRRVCESRGWACNGSVNVKGREAECDEHTAGPGLAPDLMRRGAVTMMRDDPKLREKSAEEVREAVLDRHGPST